MMSRYIKIAVFTLASLSLILFPLKAEAIAFIPIIIGLAVASTASYYFAPAILNEVGKAIIGIIDTIVNYTFGLLIVLSVNIIKFVIGIQNFLFKIEAVREVWTIFRDFANIFFILLLIITAFATILNYQKYNYKELLPKIIIAALLINFSFVIFQGAVDLMWLPSNLFIGAIAGGTFDPNLIGDKLGEIFQVKEIQTGTFAEQARTEAAAKGGELVFTLFKGLLYVAIGFALGWIAFVLLARIPILIGLAIISPIAWISFAFPAIRNVWSTWWNQLIKWGLIPFYYLAVIYFVLFFNQRVGGFLGQVPFTGEATDFWPLAFNTTILMFINLGLLFYGLYWAHQFAGKSGVYGYSWAGSVFGAIPYVGQVPGAVTKTLGRIQKEGLPVKIPKTGIRLYGGQAAREAQQAKLEDILGKGIGLRPTYEIERKRIEEAEKTMTDIENRIKRISGLSPADAAREEKRIIAEAAKKGLSSPEGLAGVMLMAKKGQLDITTFNNTVKQFEKMPLVLTRVFSEWKEGKFGGVRADELIPILRDIRTPLEAKRIGYNFIASDDGKRVVEDRSFGYAEFKEMYEILGGRNTKDGRTAKKFVGDIKPTIAGEYNFNFPTTEFDDPADYPADIADAILKQIKKTGSKDFTKYGKDIWNNPDFKAALGDLLYNKATTDIGNARKYADEVRKWLIRESKDEDELRIFNDAADVAGI